jgi:transposase
VDEPESSPAVPSNPNSRLGRSKRSPVAQAWDRMDACYVGIDVSKDRLDAHAHPAGAAFSMARKGAGLEELVERLKAFAPALVAIETTGGFETVVAAALAGAGLPVVVVNPAQVRHVA